MCYLIKGTWEGVVVEVVSVPRYLLGWVGYVLLN